MIPCVLTHSRGQVNGEIIGRTVGREAFAAFLEVSKIEEGINVSVAACLFNVIAKIIEDHGHSGCIVAEFIRACTITSHGVDLILYSACAKQELELFDT